MNKFSFSHVLQMILARFWGSGAGTLSPRDQELVMRISTSMLNGSAVSAILRRIQSNLSNTQQQLSSGLSIKQPFR